MRWLGEVTEQSRDKDRGLVTPIENADSVVDGYIKGKITVHLNIGLRCGAFDKELCEFCADLQVIRSRAVSLPSKLHNPGW